MAMHRRVRSWPAILIAAFSFVLCLWLYAVASEPVVKAATIEIVAHGKVIRSTSTTLYGDRVLAAAVSNGEVVAPMSTVLALFSAKSDIDRSTGSVVIVGTGHRLSFELGSREANIDGTPTELGVPPVSNEGVVLLPLRVIASAFGADVAWISERKTVVIEPVSSATATATAPSVPIASPTAAASASSEQQSGATCCCCKKSCCGESKADDKIATDSWILPALLVFFEIVIFCVLVAYRAKRGLTWLLFAQLFIGFLGVVGATLNAFPVSRKEDTQYPLFDASTAAWLALVLIAYFMPRIAKLKWFNTEVEIREELKDTAQLFEKSSKNWADILQNWSQATAIFIAQCDEKPELRTLLLMNFVRDRMGEAKVLLLPEVTEDETSVGFVPVDANQVRLSAWIFDPHENVLRFFWSNEIVDGATQQTTFAPGVGLVGQAFLEGRIWNEADAEAVPGFVKIAGQPRIGAVICAPIWLRERSKAMGMITADRPTVGKFSQIDCDIVMGLAALIAIAWRSAGLNSAAPEGKGAD